MQDYCRCRLPVLMDLSTRLLRQNPAEHTAGPPLIAALRRINLNTEDAETFALRAAPPQPDDKLPCELRSRLAAQSCNTAFALRASWAAVLIPTLLLGARQIAV